MPRWSLLCHLTHSLTCLQLLAASLQRDVPAALRRCPGALDELRRLQDALEQMKNPAEFVYRVHENLSVNGRAILEELNAAVHYHAKGMWEEMGQAIGQVGRAGDGRTRGARRTLLVVQALAKLVVGPPQGNAYGVRSRRIERRALVLGMLRGVGAEFPDLEKCIRMGARGAVRQRLADLSGCPMQATAARSSAGWPR